MKTGRTLQELAAELQRHADTRKDYIADQGAIEAAVNEENEVVIDGLNGDPLSIAPHAHTQIAQHLEIPQKYYDKMREKHPDLLAENVNAWLGDAKEEKRMIRTLDGKVRAFLSSKYRPLDNYDLANAVMPTLLARKVKVMSVELTETRMYIKGILEELSDKLPDGIEFGVGHHNVSGPGGTREGARLVAAVTISNSDVGNGALRVEPSVFTTWCTNLAIIAEAAMRKYHVGRAHDAMEDFSVFRDETRAADDKAFWLKVRDTVEAAFAEEKFRQAVESIRRAAGERIVSKDLPKVVEVTVKRLGLAEGMAPSILTELARGGDLSKWGLSSAITAAANEYGDYEGATDLERAGGRVIALGKEDWRVISEAAA